MPLLRLDQAHSDRLQGTAQYYSQAIQDFGKAVLQVLQLSPPCLSFKSSMLNLRP